MPKSYNILPRAQEDLEEIIAYIAQDNLSAAYRVRKDLREAFKKLAEHPQIGHARADITDKAVRFWNVYSYHIIYDPKSSPLMVLRILSSYRDIEALLND